MPTSKRSPIDISKAANRATRSVRAKCEQRSNLANSTPEAGSRKPEAALSPSSCLAATLLEEHDNRTTSAQQSLAKLRKEHEQTLDRLESKLLTLQHRRRTRAASLRQSLSPSAHSPDASTPKTWMAYPKAWLLPLQAEHVTTKPSPQGLAKDSTPGFDRS